MLNRTFPRALLAGLLAVVVLVVALGTATPADASTTGTVRIEQRGPDGEPAPGGCWAITAVDINDHWGVACDRDDEVDGLVIADELPPGNYRFEQFEAPDGYKAATESITTNVGDDDDVDSFVATHELLPSIRIRTTDAEGTALAGSCWQVHNPGEIEGYYVHACDTDDGAADGLTTTHMIRPGDYDLSHAIKPLGYLRVATAPFTMGDNDVEFVFALERVVKGVNLTPPTITGPPAAGATLTGDIGTWDRTDLSFTTRWQQCDSAGSACIDIAGSNGNATYVVSAADADKTLRFAVAAHNEAGTVNVVSAPVTVLDLAAPANVVAPTISGTVAVGQTLATNPGSWTNAPTFTYQWQRCALSGVCTDIANARFATYTPTTADDDYAIRVVVTGTNEMGSGTATSAVTTFVSAAPHNQEQPFIRGTVEVGQVLEAFPGHWVSYYGPFALDYIWERCATADPASCAPLGLSAADMYTVLEADEGFRIRVKVTATDAGGTGVAYTNMTAVVPSLRPLNVSPPEVRGTIRLGSSLTGYVGAWTAPSGTWKYSTRWFRCDTGGDNCTPVEKEYKGNALDSKYTIVRADADHTLRVAITATNDHGSRTAWSAPSALVRLYPPVNISAPVVNGSVRLGQTVSANVGVWDFFGVTGRFQFRWQRCDENGNACVLIDKDYKDRSSDADHVITRDDVGHTLRALIYASSPEGWTPAVSAPTAVIQLYPPVNISAPTVSGNVRLGQTLQSNVGVWDFFGTTGRFQFRWQRCDANGDACVLIDKDYKDRSSDADHVITGDDVGHTFRALIYASSAEGWTPAVSAPTAVIQLYPPVNISAPTVTGSARLLTTLQGNVGVWDFFGVTGRFQFRWQRCDENGNACVLIDKDYKNTIADARHAVGFADMGHTLRVLIYASSSEGWTPAVSAPSPVVAL